MNEKEEKTIWKTTDTRFVAFFDILGFKELVMRKQHEEIYKMLSELTNFIKLLETIPEKNGFDSVKDSEIYIVRFSDSIGLFSKSNRPTDFFYFLLAARWLFTYALKHRIMLKGGISCGEISVNKSEQIYFGQAIIDAYLIEEDVNYIGIVAHNSINQYINTLKSKDKERVEGLMFELRTPMKSGKITHHNINWFKIIDKGGLDKVRDLVQSFKVDVSGSPRRYLDNTLDIINDIEKANHT